MPSIGYCLLRFVGGGEHLKYYYLVTDTVIPMDSLWCALRPRRETRYHICV